MRVVYPHLSIPDALLIPVLLKRKPYYGTTLLFDTNKYGTCQFAIFIGERCIVGIAFFTK
jgi:hypothetical protein